jgi:membrane associated rhomboid family serine protease
MENTVETDRDDDDVRILDFWKEGEVWFLDRFPRDRPWADESYLEAVPEEARGHYGVKVADYATVDGQRYQPGEMIIAESREKLRYLAAHLNRVQGLVFPWYDRIVPPTLWLPHRRRIELKSYRKQIEPALLKAFFITCLGVAVAFVYPQYLILALIGAMHFGLYPLVQNSSDWLKRVDRYSVDDLNEQLTNGELFRRWLLSLSTFPIKVAIGILALIFVGQILVDKETGFSGLPPSIEAAALMKDAVTQDGEWWRIVTTGLMHGSLLHIAFNGMALFSLGRVVAALANPAYLVIVFLLTVISGSLASIYLGPPNPSVGASGGILGCLGFLLVVNRKFRDIIPSYLNASLIQSTIVIAVFGLIGSMFIDNAAHAGGFLGGIAIGLVCYPRLRLGAKEESPLVKWVARVCAIILLAGVAKVAWELWQVGSAGS